MYPTILIRSPTLRRRLATTAFGQTPLTRAARINTSASLVTKPTEIASNTSYGVDTLATAPATAPEAFKNAESNTAEPTTDDNQSETNERRAQPKFHDWTFTAMIGFGCIFTVLPLLVVQPFKHAPSGILMIGWQWQPYQSTKNGSPTDQRKATPLP